MANLLWLQGGACSGNTMSFLNAEEPSACDLVTDFGINVLWHPSLGGLERVEDRLRRADPINPGSTSVHQSFVPTSNWTQLPPTNGLDLVLGDDLCLTPGRPHPPIRELQISAEPPSIT